MRLAFLVILSLLVTPLLAQASIHSATGSGWVNDVSGPNNTNTSVIANHFAGGIDRYRNWFAFDIPSLGTITSATLYIWNDSANSNSIPTATYRLYEASAITFTGLVSGPILGSVLTSVADAGGSHYEPIALNAAGIAALDAAQGSQFIFGGSNDGDEIFGYTGGAPVAYLDLSASATGAVPEPLSIMVWVGLACAATTVAHRRFSKS
jgi:hypothetical protein